MVALANLIDTAGPELRVLALGAHADDIEIGCGGTILRLLETERPIKMKWVVFSGDQERRDEACRSAKLFMGDGVDREISVEQFRDGFFPFEGAGLKQYFEDSLKNFGPDIVFTHHLGDRHQDHRTVAELTWNTFRRQLIVEFEIPKYDADLGKPNVFVSLHRSTCEQKVENIMSAFSSQRHRPWFSSDTFWSLLRLRGVESGSPYAEAFHVRKLVLTC